MNRSRKKLHRSSELWLSHVYDRHVQKLYKYGMNVCDDSRIVLHVIQELVVHLGHQPELLVPGPTLRFCLFKRFRDLLSKHLSSDRFASPPPVAHIDSVDEGPALLPLQREASFLKLYCAFSYQEVAGLMNLELESIYELVMQAIEISRKSKQEYTTPVYEIH